MADWRSREDAVSAEGSEPLVIRRRGPGRFFAFVGLALLLLLVLVLAALWIFRRPIAGNVLERELEQRGVQASYELVRVGLRTQQVRNLVIGDPRRPDLVARDAQIQIRITLDGGVEVYRIVARGVRLRGRLVGGRVSWGQIDRLLPPPTDEPFRLPDFVLDIADASIALATPYGPLGFAVQGNGNLSGGFRGRLAVSSPRLDPGRCQLLGMRANLALAVTARRPHVDGPFVADRFACPASSMAMERPRFDLDSTFNESFTEFDGRGRMAVATMVAGANGLANFVGNLTFGGSPDTMTGDVDLAAQRSRLGPVYAERTRLRGKYRLGAATGTFVMLGEYAANSGTLDPSMLGGVTDALAAAKGTPLGPAATSIGNAVTRTAGNFDATGEIRVVNFPGGGAARVQTADIRGPNGARAELSGGDGFTYYWWSGRVRVDGLIEMAGGGLPTGRVLIRQPRNGAPMSGVAEFEPYRVGNSRLALAPIRFAAQRDGSTAVSTAVLLDGPYANGRVRALRVPLEGRFGGRTGLAVGTRCAVVSWDLLQYSSLQLGRTRLPVCPVGAAMVSQPPGGSVRWGAAINRPQLAGRLGESPLRLSAANARIVGREFSLAALRTSLGQSESPIIFNADRLRGTFAGSGVSGTFAMAESTIRQVPVRLSEGDGRWRFLSGDLFVDADATVTDRASPERFYPLRADDLAFKLDDMELITAEGTLRHPRTGALVSNVDIRHDLSSGTGGAVLDVAGLTFNGLQPDEITPLTEGVIALVNGTVTGQGRIDWNAAGEVTSSGEFSTADLDFAAPFGPVTGLRGNIHFDDLLGLTTPPGQVATIESINPGILVENGVVRYQLLPGQLVRIERGEWPFMGGRLILQETVLNFARPTAKRLTFEVVGLDAKTFVESLGFAEFEATGTFDGVLPMIFDETGGRIVGGRLDSRPPGGSLAYNGVVNRANLGMMGGIAFDALRDLRFRSMIVRLDGELAGEFVTRSTIDGVALGQTTTARIIRSLFSRLPLKLNLTIRGPFRALIATAKSFRDPRTLIGDVLPRPLDEVPGIVTEVRRREEEQTQTQTPPNEEIDVSTSPTPTPSER